MINPFTVALSSQFNFSSGYRGVINVTKKKVQVVFEFVLTVLIT